MIVIKFILVLLLQCSLYNKIVYFVNNQRKKILFLELAKIIVEWVFYSGILSVGSLTSLISRVLALFLWNCYLKNKSMKFETTTCTQGCLKKKVTRGGERGLRSQNRPHIDAISWNLSFVINWCIYYFIFKAIYSCLCAIYLQFQLINRNSGIHYTYKQKMCIPLTLA